LGFCLLYVQIIFYNRSLIYPKIYIETTQNFK
jgi:hypothetical protein